MLSFTDGSVPRRCRRGVDSFRWGIPVPLVVIAWVVLIVGWGFRLDRTYPISTLPHFYSEFRRRASENGC